MSTTEEKPQHYDIESPQIYRCLQLYIQQFNININIATQIKTLTEFFRKSDMLIYMENSQGKVNMHKIPRQL